MACNQGSCLKVIFWIRILWKLNLISADPDKKKVSDMKKKEVGSELIRGDRQYTYFAFISYKREDGKWAEWLQRKLQSYRLPSKLCRQYKTLQQRCDPVFLDKTDLKPGFLEEELRSEVQEAKFLIVICSRNACRNSRYLDLETQLFLDSGGDPSRIIPFIVDNAKEPEKNCFPKRLQEVCAEHNIVGANIYDQGKRRAFLKVVAYMHGLKVQEVEHNDFRRRRRNLIIASVAGGASLVAAGVGGYLYWDYNVPKTAFYQSYTEEYGVPVGIGPLSENEIRSMSGHYRITSSRHKVRSLQYENAFGTAIAAKQHEICEAPERTFLVSPLTRADYTYTDDGALAAVVCRNEDGEALYRIEYGKSMKYIDFFSETDEYGSGNYQLSHGASQGTPDLQYEEEGEDEDAAKAEIMRYIIEYDEQGHVSEVHYANYTNTAVADADGCGGLRFVRDELGRAVRVYYLSHTGDGTSAIDPGEYSVTGTRQGTFCTEYQYNEHNELTGILFLGKDDIPNIRYGNVAKVRRIYENHLLKGEEYFGPDGRPCMIEKGYASFTAEYDASGCRTGMKYFGPGKEPIVNTRGFAAVSWDYDEKGRTTASHYYGVDGTPVLSTDGYAGAMMEYDAGDHVTCLRYLGTDGNAVISTDGSAGFRLEYDSEGRQIKKTFFGMKEELINCSEGYAVCSMEYNEQGLLIKESFFGADGKPAICDAGYATIVRDYNERGQETRESFFDTEERPVQNRNGYAVAEYTYDTRNNLVGASYLGVSGEPVTVFDKTNTVAGSLLEYDDNGHLIQASVFDENGHLTLGEEHYAYAVLGYDEMGNNDSESYYGVDHQPVNSVEGFASCSRTYDARGNLLKEEYYDTAGKPVLCAGGYALATEDYDLYGNPVRISYYGLDGRLKNNTAGYAYCDIEYNAYGVESNCTFFDAEGVKVQYE